MNDELNEVEVVYSPVAGQVISVVLKCDSLLTTGAIQQEDVLCTVRDAILQSKLLNEITSLQLAEISVGIWGRKVCLDDEVKAGDRIEIYRDLKIDPKEARRLRYQKQGPVRSRHRPGYKGL